MKTKPIRVIDDEPNGTRTTQVSLESAMSSAVRTAKGAATARETSPSFGPSFEPWGNLMFAVSQVKSESECGNRFRHPENRNRVRSAAKILPNSPSPAPEASACLPRWKRTLDLFIILLSSPLWLPLMILIMVAIKVTSGGAVFYRQERVGYRGRLFLAAHHESERGRARGAHQGERRDAGHRADGHPVGRARIPLPRSGRIQARDLRGASGLTSALRDVAHSSDL